MAKGALVGDLGSAHDGFPPTPIIAGASSVKIDGRAVARMGDPLVPHDKPKNTSHPRSIKEGSTTVMIEGKPAARVGDAISCCGVIVGGSTVNIG